MPKQKFKITPKVSANDQASLDRFLVELNSRLEEISDRLPTLDIRTTTALMKKRRDVDSTLNGRANDVPSLGKNPIDTNALRDDLDHNVVPAIQAELEELRRIVVILAGALGDTMVAVIE